MEKNFQVAMKTFHWKLNFSLIFCLQLKCKFFKSIFCHILQFISTSMKYFTSYNEINGSYISYIIIFVIKQIKHKKTNLVYSSGLLIKAWPKGFEIISYSLQELLSKTTLIFFSYHKINFIPLQTFWIPNSSIHTHTPPWMIKIHGMAALYYLT